MGDRIGRHKALRGIPILCMSNCELIPKLGTNKISKISEAFIPPPASNVVLPPTPGYQRNLDITPTRGGVKKDLMKRGEKNIHRREPFQEVNPDFQKTAVETSGGTCSSFLIFLESLP